MEIVEIGRILIIGIFINTTNESGKSQIDIAQLWNGFQTQNIMAKIPNRVGNDVYAVYTNYQGDHTQPYDFFIGCAVSSFEEIPDGMKGISIAAGSYGKIEATGENSQKAVFDAWQQVWNSEMNRVYQTDFERYTPTNIPGNFDISVFVGLK